MKTTETFHPPPAFLRVAETLESHGHEAWAVGGALRDGLVGVDRADWDLATDARPEQVCAIFPRTVPLGIEHGTVGVLAGEGKMYEVTTFRLDVETDGRHAVVRFADSIDDDLARRDFTINAMAWRPATDELRDPFDGRRDLEALVLRAVGDPPARFAEDHLRVLRGLRFAGRLGLVIDPATREALEHAVPQLVELSAERVREELMKVLSDSFPSRALGGYAEIGALAHWYRELEPVAAEPGTWAETLTAVDRVATGRPVVRLVRWLIPIGDEETREGRGRRLMWRLRFSNAETARVARLLRHYSPFVGPMDSAAELRRWLSEVGRETAYDLFRLHIAAAHGGPAEMRGYMTAAWRAVHDELLEHPPLGIADLEVSGNDLLALGVEPGPLVGAILAELHARVLDDPARNDRERLLASARELIAAAAGGAHGREPDEETRDEG